MLVPLLGHLRRNAVAYLALFVALGGTSFAAATVITGRNVKNGSLTGKDVRNSSLTGTDVKDESLSASDFNGSVQGPQGDTGPKGDKGDTGPKGADGSDATVNGVAAGGDLAGSFPNPTIADEAVTTAKLAPGMQEATVLDVPRGTPQNDPSTFGPQTGQLRLIVFCQSAPNGMRVSAQQFGPTTGEMHGIYVRGTTTVKRFDFSPFYSANSQIVVDTAAEAGAPGNDSGTGSFIMHSPSSTVSGTFSYLADDTHCQLLAAMHRMQ